jgi:hypothetical protein
MSVERMVRAFAGGLVLISIALGLLVSPYWFIMTGFVGLNLFQSAFTGFCPAETFFKQMKRPAETSM